MAGNRVSGARPTQGGMRADDAVCLISSSSNGTFTRCVASCNTQELPPLAAAAVSMVLGRDDANPRLAGTSSKAQVGVTGERLASQVTVAGTQARRKLKAARRQNASGAS